ncbi:acyl-CoA thioesterase [Bacillus horti]|uniref:Acyl-CoA thioester hydrolase n=1 Tax=Caldalkalibacillus horti TaxID=77523 RepID=A0ABT9VT72_9BACI|nr:thioesterase family protein [Bacillus horti]MDQ0164184.1 acyl-CoA thioester hydrolase [Bacillus horti]
MGHHSEIRVRYKETDQMGVVHHGNYLTWFEVGRTDMLRHFGPGYRAVEESGLLLPVTDVSLSYHKPALYDDLITIDTKLISYTGIRMTFHYTVKREEDVLVTGVTKHCWTTKSLKPVRLKHVSLELHQLMTDVLEENSDD